MIYSKLSTKLKYIGAKKKNKKTIRFSLLELIFFGFFFKKYEIKQSKESLTAPLETFLRFTRYRKRYYFHGTVDKSNEFLDLFYWILGFKRKDRN